MKPDILDSAIAEKLLNRLLHEVELIGRPLSKSGVQHVDFDEEVLNRYFQWNLFLDKLVYPFAVAPSNPDEGILDLAVKYLVLPHFQRGNH